MRTVNLKSYRCTQLQFTNNLAPNKKIELANKYSYNCGYTKGNICRGEFKVEVSDKEDPNNFGITVVMVGIFEIAEDLPKEKLHVESFRELFPFVRALVATVTTNAGMPPVIIPAIDIEKQEIYKVEMPRFRKPEEGTQE